MEGGQTDSEALSKRKQRSTEYKNIFNGSIKEQKNIVQVLKKT